ncbi:anti-sigma factor [Halomonas sp. 18H]|uniref:anti-sigma factor n=1 Tax=Halomonas almeriensis TaxID=308163 RepID=UPI002231462E|nr:MULTISPECIES: anti-sigma factor [Halomonas]MCW4149306.1 anti-sigma factor [Halomonas sp. 18H]MDN3553748.1 anti-sigma factor [Halomonas almeriensis]
MTDCDDLDMLAAEYVLGTLDAEERTRVAQRRQADATLNDLIQAWEARLAPLADEIKDVAPGPHLLERIEQRIEELEAQHDTRDNASQQADSDRATADTGNVVQLQRRLRFWQWGTGLATAAALVLAVLLLAPLPTQQEHEPFVAVFQQNDQQPAFMVSVELPSRELHVQAVSAEPLPDKSYQMWIKEDSLGPKPRSVGVLNDNLSLAANALSEYSPELLKRATFGISVEPPGGSPTGQPTGPAIHGYLYPATRRL